MLLNFVKSVYTPLGWWHFYIIFRQSVQSPDLLRSFTAHWYSLFILFKFQYLTKHGTLVLVYGILILLRISEVVANLPRGGENISGRTKK